MLSELFDWWARQMLDLIPVRWRRRGLHGADALVVSVADPAEPVIRIAVSRRIRGTERLLGGFRLDQPGIAALGGVVPAGRAVNIVLQIPPALLLQRDCTMPLAAEGDLERVLGYEMDRITPFAASDLFWTWRLQRRDRVNARLHLRLLLVHRAALAPVLEQLARAGLPPAMLAAVTSGGERHLIPLRRLAASGPRRGAVRVAAGICAVLALAVVATPIVQDLRAIAAADRRIDALRPAIARVDALRRRIADAAGGADLFAAEATRVGDPLQMLAALTDILPDDAWLASLTWRQRVLTFTGQSKRAARLITTLSADPLFHDPTFATPVTRADSTGAELFSIRTQTGL